MSNNDMKRLMALSVAELVQLSQVIMSDPVNKNPNKNSIFIYTPKARRKLHDIDWAIYHHQQADRKSP